MAISIFMELESEVDGVVEGGCKVENREGWVEVLEMSHGLTLPFDRTTGNITGIRVHEPYTITKATDKSTPMLYKHLCNATKWSKITLHFYDMIDNAEVEYFRVELKKAQVVAIAPAMYNPRVSQANREMPHLESVQFGYEEIVWKEMGDNIEHTDNFKAAAT